MRINDQLLHDQDVERRAADVRRRWSNAERARRNGLPPDIPWCLRQQLVGCQVWFGQVEPAHEARIHRLLAATQSNN